MIQSKTRFGSLESSFFMYVYFVVLCAGASNLVFLDGSENLLGLLLASHAHGVRGEGLGGRAGCRGQVGTAAGSERDELDGFVAGLVHFHFGK